MPTDTFLSVGTCRNKIGIIFLFCLSCQQKAEQKETELDTKPELVMYEPSEMANLMNAMYAYNLGLKQQIVSGEVPSTMPLDLMKLHSAEMSNGHERTAVWNSFVNVFI